ncbi:MAG: polysaccharide deacetylase family protein [Spirochaetes bacterium]|nr:polysaccharide deacetylase family protein [Spirochaetota bacterium]
MKEKSIGFYKRLILSVTAALILVPTTFSLFLFHQNQKLKEKPDNTVLADDVVTVGATQLEPAAISKAQPMLGYQLLYPDFKADFHGFSDMMTASKQVFLTFDDGPSMGTASLLDLLKSKDVKATFFVTGKSNRWLCDQLKRAVSEGHEVGMHSYSHRYKAIYASMYMLLDDFYHDFLYIKNETGQAPAILRFPGGSINIFNAASYQTMISEMLRRGFVYYDWNVSAGDTVAKAAAQDISANVINGVRLCWGPAVVLLHDNGSPALEAALTVVIDTLSKEGYVFRKLDSSIKPPAFVYPD